MAESDWRKSLTVRNTEYVDNLRSIELYHKYVHEMYPKFIEELGKINEIINQLKQKNKISEYVRVNARIKSQESARTKTSSKAIIHDVFGIEVVTATSKEIETISQIIEGHFTLAKQEDVQDVWLTTKTISKDNGYRALHQRFELIGDKYKTTELPIRRKIDSAERNVIITPSIEVQYKTIAVKVKSEIGSASHMKYKGKTKQQIRDLAKRGFNSGITLPRMWASNEKGEIHELSKEQVINKMYPFLDGSAENGREER